MMVSQGLLFDAIEVDEDEMAEHICSRCMRRTGETRTGARIIHDGACCNWPTWVCGWCKQEADERKAAIRTAKRTVNLARVRHHLTATMPHILRRPSDPDATCSLCGKPSDQLRDGFDVECEGRICPGCREEIKEERAIERYRKVLQTPVHVDSAGWHNRSTCLPQRSRAARADKRREPKRSPATSTQPLSLKDEVARILANEGATVRRVTRKARGYATQFAAARAAEAATLAAHSQEAAVPVELAEAV